MDRQARNGDTVLAKSREVIGRSQTLPWWPGGRRGKDDRKQNTLASLRHMVELFINGYVHFRDGTTWMELISASSVCSPLDLETLSLAIPTSTT